MIRGIRRHRYSAAAAASSLRGGLSAPLVAVQQSSTLASRLGRHGGKRSTHVSRCLGIAATVVAVTGALSSCGGATTTSTVAARAVVVAVTSPASGSVINANSVTVRGTVTPANATVSVAGQPAAVGNGVFSANANLQRGKTTVDVIGSAPGMSPGSTSVVVDGPGGSAGAPKPTSAAATSTGSSGTTPSGATPSVAYAASSAGGSGNQSPCGSGLMVGPDTSCAFAQNVEQAYRNNGPGTYDVASPVTGGTYSMSCNADASGSQVTCTGGNNASVFFPA